MCLNQSQSDDNIRRINAEVEDVQNTVKQRLNECLALLKESAKTLGESLSNGDDILIGDNMNSGNYVQDIRTKLEEIDMPPIRVPIIAPLNAGKSTILNAIIGGDILPTGAAEMTALPTAVVIKSEQNASSNVPPVELYLDKATWDGLRNLVLNAAKHLQNHFKNDKELNSLLQSNPDLVMKAREIRDARGYVLELQNLFGKDNEANGRKTSDGGIRFDDKKQIQSILTFINELVLICMYLATRQSDSSLSLNVFEDHIPLVLVNKNPLQNTQYQLKQRCQLVLIDIPGPGEASVSAQLSSIVEHQLKVADVVFDIAECTQLNADTNADIANGVDEIRSVKQDEDSVYVLISKTDLYKRRNMSKEQLKQHIAAFYKLSDKCVFLLSGNYALIAQRFFAEYRQSLQNANPIDIQSSEAAKDVLEAYCPCDWEELLNKSSPEEVNKIAENLFKISNIGIFLNDAVESVYGQVLHKCIESALDTCKKVADNSMTEVSIRLNGLELVEKQLREEIGDLNQDLHDLSVVHDDHPSIIANISNLLETELKSLFQQALQDLKNALNKVFDSDNEIWGNPKTIERQDTLSKQGYLYNIASSSVFGAGLGVAASRAGASDWTIGIALTVGTLLGSLGIAACMDYFNDNEDEIQFDDVQDADKFINSICDMINKVIQNIYEAVKTAVNETLDKATIMFYNSMNQKTKPILECAGIRLSNAFHVAFSPPKNLHNSHQKFILNVQNVRYMKKSMLWSLYTLINKSNAMYFVSRTKLQSDCLNYVHDSLKQMQEHIIETARAEMKEIFLAHLQNLQIYMEKCKHYVEQLLKDKHLEQENQKNFKVELHKLKNRWTHYKKCVDDFASSSINWTELFPNTKHALSKDMNHIDLNMNYSPS